MTDPAPAWVAQIEVRLRDDELANWLEASLGPEAAREVPRASAEVRRPTGSSVELRLTARDTGSIRAAMNTYLGWVHLSLSTAEAARRAMRPSS
jgi:tRNA threonylcarbamoyladenosine modification (KEOPS) complex  Pcc1 subunit